MTLCEQAAYDAAVHDVLNMARTVAITLETAPDATDIRKQAAAGALYAFAEAARTLALSAKHNAGLSIMATIAAQPGDAGELPCPGCAGRVPWARSASNGHIRAECEAGCFSVMQ